MPRTSAHLRTVEPLLAAVPDPEPGQSVTEAAASGSTRDLLVAMRARIAVAVENPKTPARDLAALTKRLVEVVREIEAIDAREAQEATKRADAAVDADFDPSSL